MALSQELKELYSSNTASVRMYDTVELRHPQFSGPLYLVNDVRDHTFDVDGDLRAFQAYTLAISKAAKGSNQQDMQLSFSNIGRVGVEQLELAATDINSPIVAIFRIYTDADEFVKADPIELELSNVSATNQTITATAVRKNLFEYRVPSRRFDPWIFKGIAT